MCCWRRLVCLTISLAVVRAEVRLKGRVTDESGAAVAGARVEVTPGGQAVTDPTGAFALAFAEPADRKVTVQRTGFFELRDRPLRFEEGANEVTLVLNHVREVFSSVDVSASPPALDLASAAPEQQLSGAQILEVPYPTSHNLQSALRMLPSAVQDSAGRVHFDGASEDQVQYRLDGFELNDPLTGKFSSRLSVEGVQSVTVTSGAMPAEFGKGSAATLALDSIPGDDKMRYSASNFVPGLSNHKGWTFQDWTPRFNVSGPIRRGRAWFSDSADVQIIRTIIDGLPKGQDRFTSTRFSDLLHGQVNLTPSNILSGGFLMNWWRAPRTGLGVLDPAPTTVDQRSRQWFVYAKDQIYFHRGALLEFGVADLRTFGRQIPQGTEVYVITPEGRRGNNYTDALDTGGRKQILTNMFLPEYSWLGSHGIRIGAEGDHLGYSQNARRTGYEYFREDGTLVSSTRFAGSGRVRRTDTEASVHVSDTWRPRSGVSLELGLRQDWDALLGNLNLGPRLGAAWAPFGLKNTKISAGFGIVYDAPSLRVFSRPQDQYSITTVFNPDGSIQSGPGATLFLAGGRRLKTPYSRNWNLNFDQQIGHSLFLHAGYLRRRLRDGLTYVASQGSMELTDPLALPAGLASLQNARRDVYDSVQLTVRRNFRKQYEWMATYTRSRALSNAVYDLTADNPVLVTNNTGRMPWDAPNRFLTWGVLPIPRVSDNWALAYMAEMHSGFPFSIQDEVGHTIGEANSLRFPVFFELNLHLERKFAFRGQRWAIRGGFNNLTNRANPMAVNNNIDSPHFLEYYGGNHRVLNFRVRWLGKAEATP